MARRTCAPERTVKSCGPDAAVLALSPHGESIVGATEAKEPFSGESTKQAVKPLRREYIGKKSIYNSTRCG